MKRKFFYLIALAVAVILTATTSVTGYGQITLNFSHAGNVTIGVAGSNEATIDWGDGSPVQTHSLTFSMLPISHNYANATPRTITITGGSIRGLVCTDMGLTSLDVSKIPTLSILDCSRNNLTNIDVGNNTDLRHLTCTHNQLTNLDVSKIVWLAHIRCSYNQLTTLDVSKNVAIKNLYCDNNKLDVNGMDNFFRSLHSNTINGGKAIFVADNPGLAGSNTSLARERGWPVQQRQQETPLSMSNRFENDQWRIGFNERGLNVLESVKDPYQANLLGGELGDVLLSYKAKNSIWIRINQTTSLRGREMNVDRNSQTVSYHDAGLGNVVELTQRFRLDGDLLHWNIEVKNNSEFPIEIGDLAIAFPSRSGRGGSERNAIFEKNYSRHSFISGDASFLYFTRTNGEAPYFLMTVDPGTKLEYTDNSRLFIYSGKTGGDEKRGTWRQEHTRTWLQPAGSKEDKLTYGFTLHIADSYPQMREKIVASRLIDIDVAPGMTVPLTQKAKFSLNTLCSIDSIDPEFPAQTSLKYLGKKGDHTHLYEVEFRKLGENMLTVNFDGNRKTCLEFYCCESPETITKKRSSFIVHNQQFRDPSKWYNGMYGVYDMVKGELLGPDNPDMFDDVLTYYIGCDDPILGKAPFVASKNVVFPDDAEIASLEYHIKNFVWGGLQRTEKETPYPYAIYGTPNWFINRNHNLRLTQTVQKLNVIRAWRSFDYAHMAMLYWHMYQIASLYPEKSTFMTADQYLEMAFNTAKSFFIYPIEFIGEYYEPYKWGCYNELIFVDLIDELEAKGFKGKAADLRKEWERKAKWFIYDEPYPYSSEYVTDRTAFESSYFLAKYGVVNDMKPDTNLWYDPNEGKWYSHPVVTKAAARNFMERQLYAALSTRATLEAQWYRLGGDNSYSYMARMGATAVLDYGYRFAENPYEWLRLGYAGHIGPFGVVNTGTAESGWGFWFPGKEKDGAMGQSFVSAKIGRNWVGTEEPRGLIRYCGEADLGMSAITRTAVTMLVDDPIFGWTVFGGNLTEEQKLFAVYPDDGARIRFRLVNDKIRIGLELDRDNWSATQPIVVNKELRSMELKLENGVSGKHTTRLTIDAKGVRNPKLSVEGKNISSKQDRYGNWIFDFSVDRPITALKVTW